MPSVVATVKVKKDKIDEAKAFFRELAAGVGANEPGTLSYIFHQQVNDPTVFVAYEKYADKEAFDLHGKNLASKGASFAAVMDGPPSIVMLEEI
jgi:quinol monooxygenase YgiN